MRSVSYGSVHCLSVCPFLLQLKQVMNAGSKRRNPEALGVSEAPLNDALADGGAVDCACGGPAAAMFTTARSDASSWFNLFVMRCSLPSFVDTACMEQPADDTPDVVFADLVGALRRLAFFSVALASWRSVGGRAQRLDSFSAACNVGMRAASPLRIAINVALVLTHKKLGDGFIVHARNEYFYQRRLVHFSHETVRFACRHLYARRECAQ